MGYLVKIRNTWSELSPSDRRILHEIINSKESFFRKRSLELLRSLKNHYNKTDHEFRSLMRGINLETKKKVEKYVWGQFLKVMAINEPYTPHLRHRYSMVLELLQKIHLEDRRLNINLKEIHKKIHVQSMAHGELELALLNLNWQNSMPEEENRSRQKIRNNTYQSVLCQVVFKKDVTELWFEFVDSLLQRNVDLAFNFDIRLKRLQKVKRSESDIISKRYLVYMQYFRSVHDSLVIKSNKFRKLAVALADVNITEQSILNDLNILGAYSGMLKDKLDDRFLALTSTIPKGTITQDLYLDINLKFLHRQRRFKELISFIESNYLSISRLDPVASEFAEYSYQYASLLQNQSPRFQLNTRQKISDPLISLNRLFITWYQLLVDNDEIGARKLLKQVDTRLRRIENMDDYVKFCYQEIFRKFRKGHLIELSNTSLSRFLSNGPQQENNKLKDLEYLIRNCKRGTTHITA